MLAFLPSLGYQEMFLLVVVGLLLYGRNLPEAGRSLGRVAAQLRRGWHEFKEQMDRDGDLREVKKSLQDTKEELKRVAAVPRAIADPRSAVRDFAKDAMTTTTPEEPPARPETPAAANGAEALPTPSTPTEPELPR